jgi:hypothetical protein
MSEQSATDAGSTLAEVGKRLSPHGSTRITGSYLKFPAAPSKVGLFRNSPPYTFVFHRLGKLSKKLVKK